MTRFGITLSGLAIACALTTQLLVIAGPSDAETGQRPGSAWILRC